jgi:hypothetical protein
MALQFGVATRNARLDALEGGTALGTAPILTIKTLTPPANCAAGNVGTILAQITLPSDWLAAAAAGSKSILGGPWTTASALAGGTAQHFRIHTNPGNVCEMQGTVGTSGADLNLDNNVIVLAQTVQITSFTITDGNA